MSPNSVVTKPPMPYPNTPAANPSVTPELFSWMQGLLAGTVNTQPTSWPDSVNVPAGLSSVQLPDNFVPEDSVAVYRARVRFSGVTDPNSNLPMYEKLRTLIPVTSKIWTYPNDRGGVITEVVYFAKRADLEALVNQPAQAAANTLWDKAWNSGGFEAGFAAWKAGQHADAVLKVGGEKIELAELISSVLRNQTNEVLRINSTMNDMNQVLKKLNSMSADAKNKNDTDRIAYSEGIAMGSTFAGGNSWAANVKPLWESWGVDTSKFVVTTMANGQGRLEIEKRYIEVVMESVKIALDKASSEAQQKQLTLNNTLTQYNNNVEGASALIQSYKNMNQALLR